GGRRASAEPARNRAARLKRVAHRIIWVNPLRATPGFAPLAGGMAAALPHVDALVAGHSLEALESVVAEIGR
ncbi:MAG: VWA domain-containing protein, partial [Actinomycetota bacterium]